MIIISSVFINSSGNDRCATSYIHNLLFLLVVVVVVIAVGWLLLVAARNMILVLYSLDSGRIQYVRNTEQHTCMLAHYRAGYQTSVRFLATTEMCLSIENKMEHKQI